MNWPAGPELRHILFLAALISLVLQQIVVVVPPDWTRPSKLLAIVIIFICVSVILFFRFSVRSGWPHYRAEQYYYSIGDLAMAEKKALATLNVNPKFYRAIIDLGNIYDDRAHYTDAIRCYQHALDLMRSEKQDWRIQINRKITYKNLGLTYRRAGDPENAWLYLRKAYETKALDANGAEFGTDWWSSNPNDCYYYVPLNDKEGFKRTWHS